MGGVGIKKGECMYDLDKYYPSRYRRLLLNIAHDVLDQYKEKDRGVTDVQSAKNTFNTAKAPIALFLKALSFSL